MQILQLKLCRPNESWHILQIWLCDHKPTSSQSCRQMCQEWCHRDNPDPALLPEQTEGCVLLLTLPWWCTHALSPAWTLTSPHFIDLLSAWDFPGHNFPLLPLNNPSLSNRKTALHELSLYFQLHFRDVFFVSISGECIHSQRRGCSHMLQHVLLLRASSSS